MEHQGARKPRRSTGAHLHRVSAAWQLTEQDNPTQAMQHEQQQQQQQRQQQQQQRSRRQSSSNNKKKNSIGGSGTASPFRVSPRVSMVHNFSNLTVSSAIGDEGSSSIGGSTRASASGAGFLRSEQSTSSLRMGHRPGRVRGASVTFHLSPQESAMFETLQANAHNLYQRARSSSRKKSRQTSQTSQARQAAAAAMVMDGNAMLMTEAGSATSPSRRSLGSPRSSITSVAGRKSIVFSGSDAGSARSSCSRSAHRRQTRVSGGASTAGPPSPIARVRASTDSNPSTTRSSVVFEDDEGSTDKDHDVHQSVCHDTTDGSADFGVRGSFGRAYGGDGSVVHEVVLDDWHYDSPFQHHGCYSPTCPCRQTGAPSGTTHTWPYCK